MRGGYYLSIADEEQLNRKNEITSLVSQNKIIGKPRDLTCILIWNLIGTDPGDKIFLLS